MAIVHVTVICRYLFGVKDWISNNYDNNELKMQNLALMCISRSIHSPQRHISFGKNWLGPRTRIREKNIQEDNFFAAFLIFLLLCFLPSIRNNTPIIIFIVDAVTGSEKVLKSIDCVPRCSRCRRHTLPTTWLQIAAYPCECVE